MFWSEGYSPLLLYPSPTSDRTWYGSELNKSDHNLLWLTVANELRNQINQMRNVTRRGNLPGIMPSTSPFGSVYMYGAALWLCIRSSALQMGSFAYHSPHVKLAYIWSRLPTYRSYLIPKKQLQDWHSDISRKWRSNNFTAINLQLIQHLVSKLL